MALQDGSHEKIHMEISYQDPETGKTVKGLRVTAGDEVVQLRDGQPAAYQRTIDRTWDNYEELVSRGGKPWNGLTPQPEEDEPEWIHVTQEPLSEHQGHGSAASKRSEAGEP